MIKKILNNIKYREARKTLHPITKSGLSNLRNISEEDIARVESESVPSEDSKNDIRDIESDIDVSLKSVDEISDEFEGGV